MKKFETIQDVSDEVETLLNVINRHLVNLTKKCVSLSISKEKGIITDLKLETIKHSQKKASEVTLK